MPAWLTGRMTRSEWLRLLGFGTVVLLLHVLGWGLFWLYSRDYPTLAGLGTLAYTFGLRHAFDADHIAAIDNTTRRFLQDGKRAHGAGFFFSLGHSTIVFALVGALAVAAPAVGTAIPVLRSCGSYAGTGVSAAFLWIIGVLNLFVVIDMARLFTQMRHGSCDTERLEQRLLHRGFMNRLLLGRVASKIKSSWHMYPLGVLFGLGFDTASEVGLLAVAAGVAGHRLPVLAVMSLPLLFAAGMSLLDTADGVFMSQAYGWAFSSPVRRLYYNLTVTGISVVIALAVGTLELVQVGAGKLGLGGGIWRLLEGIDLSRLGYATAALFVLAWVGAAVVWRLARVAERWPAATPSR